MYKYDRGSDWRKWDLHIHPPTTKLNDAYRSFNDHVIIDIFCKVIEESDYAAFGITDYFSMDAYNSFTKRFKELFPNSNKVFFFNLELRLNISISKEQENIHMHLLFNNNIIDSVPRFLTKLKTIKRDSYNRNITCDQLSSSDDFMSATVSVNDISEAIDETFGTASNHTNNLLIISSCGSGGIRPTPGAKRKEILSDEIDKFSDAFFGNINNVQYYLKTNRYNDIHIYSPPKPVFSCSDCHSFDDMRQYYDSKSLDQTTGRDEIQKQFTWIKADVTYEGLLQVLFEPHEGERIKISESKPDVKDDYRIIDSIEFVNSSDFPDKIVFNQNLCSIIGSRSSGKSALLAYLADSVNREYTRSITDGPGVGNSFRWNNIKDKYTIKWKNGKDNSESPGNVIFIPQNYLNRESQDPDKLNLRIMDILHINHPNIMAMIDTGSRVVCDINESLSTHINQWFELQLSVKIIETKLQGVGHKLSIQDQIATYTSEIDKLRLTSNITQNERENYENLSTQISILSSDIRANEGELKRLTDLSDNNTFFISADITLNPRASLLPENTRLNIETVLRSQESNIVNTMNLWLVNYTKNLKSTILKAQLELNSLMSDNKILLDKIKGNSEINHIMELLNGQKTNLKMVEELEMKRSDSIQQLRTAEESILKMIKERDALLEREITEINQDGGIIIGDINVQAELGLPQSIYGSIRESFNLRENTRYVNNALVDFVKINDNIAEFMHAVYNDEQKVKSDRDKGDVIRNILTLTKNVYFVAYMEKDRIGGLESTTMTPGKMALFALRLLLAESNDKWPLLIDQPEDDLDSRSIYTDIVPFVRKKKKERQIIMVSHNANLVISTDSEQIIVANRHGSDRPNEDGRQFNYKTGGMENTYRKENINLDTLNRHDIAEHACEILDGGKEAFNSRRKKYKMQG